MAISKESNYPLILVKGYYHMKNKVQYADDTSLILLYEEGLISIFIYTLDTFCLTSGLVLNQKKSSEFWKYKCEGDKPLWINKIRTSCAKKY